MKLEDIKKKNIYAVPDKYFDQLPTRIQARVNEEKPVFGFSFSWNLFFKIATPAFAVILILFYFGLSNTNLNQSAEELLAQVDAEDLIAYLETTDITTDEIIEEVDLSMVDLDFAEDQPFIRDIEIDDASMDILFDEYGIESETL
ncbi:MAG: hypothetical protein MI975_13355 [Cytophagales bacterium]|nr:hypothetical protein [Cytophagales bacterium]